MKTNLAIIILALILACSSVMATNTRVTTMGDNNLILLDDANIFLFPSRLYDYGGLAVAEFDDDDMAEFGVHWKFNKENPWVLGTYLYNNTATEHDYSPVFAPLGENKRLDMFYARKLGTNKFGFHLGLRQSSDIDEKPNDKSELSLSIWNLDFGLTPEGDAIDVSVGVELMSFSNKATLENSSQYDMTKPEGNKSLYLQGRKFHKLNDECTVIPHAKLAFGGYESGFFETWNDGSSPRPDSARLGYTEKNNTLVFDLGMGLQFTPAHNVLAVMDFGFKYDKIKTEYDNVDPDTTIETSTRVFSLPYVKMGLDADVFSWLDVRFGATSYWNRQTDEDGDEKDKINWPDNETYLGFGFHWNRLHVDAQANPSLFLDGFNFLSGQSNNMNFRISAVYEMM